ncbi:hypothetical protein FSPOR_2726 [Fusarium sporotrichioides]|uniref:T6SS Phospholipase effector Tle1-like catalytic domain-containing protein n=1 Tax=Fusarium sporotrichioides TaxID=5514 RepID=A0A395SK06_FUSSP|nr:hypothetical protein FSPOR_2726 [Fusarium sporotrichioides]
MSFTSLLYLNNDAFLLAKLPPNPRRTLGEERITCFTGPGFAPFDRIFGGLCGWGTQTNVINAYKSIARTYRPGDKIILCGYSRGAWAARYLAQIISVLGLPKRGDDRFFHLLDKHCDKDPRFISPVGPELLDYDRRKDVKIEALCCFDTIGSLGLPLYGVAKPLSLFRRGPRKVDIVSTVAKIFFVGNHGDMGRIDRRKESFVHAPLAWVIQQLHWHSSIQFDEVKLKEYFPSYDRAPDEQLPCINGPVARASRSTLAFMGRKVRQPWKDIACIPTRGSNKSPSSDTSSDTELPIVQIHTSARYYKQPDTVPGYTQNNLQEGQFHWVRQGCEPQSQGRLFLGTPRTSSSSSSSRMKTSPHSVINTKRLKCVPVSEPTDSHGEKSHIIREAPVGRLEARCLGLSDKAISDRPCCGEPPEEMPAGPPKEDPVPARGGRTRQAFTRLAQSLGFSRS